MHWLRLICSGRPSLGLQPISGTCPAACWDADDLSIDVWLSDLTRTNGIPDAFDIDLIQTLRLECRLTADTESMLFAAKEVTEFTFCSYDNFKAGIGQHAQFELSNTDTNFPAGTEQVWLSIVGELTDGTRYTFAAGWLAVVLSGDSTAIQPVPDPVQPYARYGFRNIVVAGQSTVIAETREDSLTLVAGNNITLTTNATTDTVTIAAGGGSGSGDVVGPNSSTDNAIVRFDGTTGKLVQNSTATLSDVGALAVSSATIGGINAAVTGNADGYPDRIHGYVKCDEAGGIGIGQVVYISGSNGANDLAKLASAAGETTSSKTYGISASAMALNDHGYIVSNGTLTGLSISAPNVSAGTAAWLSTTAGGIKFGSPYTAAEGHSVYLGTVRKITGTGAGVTVTEINVKIQNGYELGELHNVIESTTSSVAFLTRNSSTGIWEDKSIAQTRTTLSINNVDNTSDANKPVSTATQTALNLKANLASPTFTGTVSGITASMVGLGTSAQITAILSPSGAVASGLNSDTLDGNHASAFVRNDLSQTANTFLAAPNGSAGNPSFRAIVGADIPSGSVTLSKLADITGGVLIGRSAGGSSTSGAVGEIYAGTGLQISDTASPSGIISISNVPIANGGTGLSTIGTALQVLRVKSDGSGLEYAAGSGVTGTGAVANAILRASGTSGTELKNSKLLIDDLGTLTWSTLLGSSVAHIAGPTDQAFKIAASDPVQSAGPIAGNAVSILASNGVPGSSTSGSAAGGSISIAAGSAYMLTSGAANGGSISLTGGAPKTSSGGGSGGSINITAGTGVNTGTSPRTDIGGNINITGGVTNGLGGNVNITGGAAQGTPSAGEYYGGVIIQGGYPNGTNSTRTLGGVKIATQDCTVNAQSCADITIQAGRANYTSSQGAGLYGYSGNVLIITQASANDTAASSSAKSAGGLTITLGAGGIQSGNTAGTGGVGGSSIATAGTGGAATGSGGVHTGGAGGKFQRTAGTGGAATSASGTRTGGKGGDIIETTGTGGAGSTTNGNGGDYTIITGSGGAGAGTAGLPGEILFKPGNTQVLTLKNTSIIAGKPVLFPEYAVADLPSAAAFAYARAFVNDANATTFNSIVAGAGANKVPVWSDGTNWRIG